MLYLVATPIGNLSDLTFRALETLKRVDLILCEDTRVSSRLMSHYEIKTPLKSFHQFSEKRQEDATIDLLKNGKEIALISDAGTPGVSDPGQSLIRRCHDEGIALTSLPGACAPITALTLSGLGMERFQFLGFLPKKASERKRILIEALFYPGVSIFFESPKRLSKTLVEIDQLGPKHNIAIAREMTKLHEECLMGKAKEFLNREFLGEIVLILEGNAERKSDLSPKEHVHYLMKTYEMEKNEAIKLSGQMLGIPKRELYACFIS